MKKDTYEHNVVADAQIKKKTAKPSQNPEYVGFGTRFVSYMIDTIILFLIGYAVQVMMGNNYIATLISAKTLEDIANMNPNGFLTNIIGFVVSFAYFVGFWAMNGGATPGKVLLGLKIVSKDGKSINLSTSLLRYVGFLVSNILFGIGFIWILFDKEKQGLHDKIAATYVVRTGRDQTLGTIIAIVALLFYMCLMGYVIYKSYIIAINNLPSAETIYNNQNELNISAETTYDLLQDQVQIDNIIEDSVPLIDYQNTSS
ncbi:MAG: RDD family protein [archaeon]